MYGSYSGVAYVAYGPFSGSSSLADAAARFYGDAYPWYAGAGLEGGVDFTGDGVLDLLVGASGADGDAATSGAVFVLPGS